MRARAAIVCKLAGCLAVYSLLRASARHVRNKLLPQRVRPPWRFSLKASHAGRPVASSVSTIWRERQRERQRDWPSTAGGGRYVIACACPGKLTKSIPNTAQAHYRGRSATQSSRPVRNVSDARMGERARHLPNGSQPYWGLDIAMLAITEVSQYRIPV